MPVTFTNECVVFTGIVAVADAEPLLDWLQGKAAVSVDLSACTHLHSANLQVLMAAGCIARTWPADGVLTSWLGSALGAAGSAGVATIAQSPSGVAP